MKQKIVLILALLLSSLLTISAQDVNKGIDNMADDAEKIFGRSPVSKEEMKRRASSLDEALNRAKSKADFKANLKKTERRASSGGSSQKRTANTSSTSNNTKRVGGAPKSRVGRLSAQSNRAERLARMREEDRQRRMDAMRVAELSHNATVGAVHDLAMSKILSGGGVAPSTDANREILDNRGFRGNHIDNTGEEAKPVAKRNPLEGIIPLERTIPELMEMVEKGEELTAEEEDRLCDYLEKEIEKNRQRFYSEAREAGFTDDKEIEEMWQEHLNS